MGLGGPREADIVADYRRRSDRKGLWIGDVEFLELDAALPHLPQEVVEYTAQQGREINNAGRAAGGKLLWSALVRKLDREDPGYLM